MKVLLICGSVAKKSHTNALLHYIEELFVKEKCEVLFWDLKTKPLPVILPEYHKDPTQHPDKIVKEFVDKVEKSQIVILGSPLYHGSYSGALKNALDNLRWDAFRNKWVGLVGNAGGSRASHVEHTHLRQVVNTLVGYTAQTQVGTCRDDYSESPKKHVLVDEDIKQRCQRLVSELIGLTK
jgi:NAD(P)H-dependent FMN reductase